MKHISKLLLILLLFQSCKDENPGPVTPTDGRIPNFNHRGLYVVNEGSFTQGNSTLSFIDLDSDTAYNDLFNIINERPLGDVFQSIYFHNGRGYLLVNNSQKIEVVDSATLQSITTINGIGSPRKMLAYGSKAYVTDIYENKIHVLDLNSNTVVDEIPAEGWTESLLAYNGKIYITIQQVFGNNTPGSKKGLLVLDPATDEIESFIPLAQGAESLGLDKDGFIWVLCNGGYLEEVGGLFRIDPETKSVERSLLFPAIGYAGTNMLLNRSGDRVFFIYSSPAFENHIFSVPVTATSMPAEPLINGQGKFIYGFNLNEFRNELYLSVPQFGVQNGMVYQYAIDTREVVDSFTVGIFPSQLHRNKN